MGYEKEEKMEHGKPIQAKAMGQNRAFGPVGNDNPHDVMRAGGSDPRRRQVEIVIERKIKDNDQSGYNHAYTPNADAFARSAERKAMGMGDPQPDGTYRK